MISGIFLWPDSTTKPDSRTSYLGYGVITPKFFLFRGSSMNVRNEVFDKSFLLLTRSGRTVKPRDVSAPYFPWPPHLFFNQDLLIVTGSLRLSWQLW